VTASAPVREPIVFDPPLDTAADVYRRRLLVFEPDAEPGADGPSGREPQASEGVAVCDLEDDFHHFVVTIRHDGHSVTATEAESYRWPWATCPAAGESLHALVGMPLAPRFTATGSFADPHWNCTHQFDAASLAITHAWGRVAGTRAQVRQYDAEIGAHMKLGPDGVGRNRLWVDGVLALEWTIAVGRGIVEPEPPFDGAPWRGGFMRWADSSLEPEAAERAIVLRRVCDIGHGRGMALDDVPVASDLLAIQNGVCYTMQPEIAINGSRHVGSIRDFASDPDQLCAGTD
jgi:hypothetical protein